MHILDCPEWFEALTLAERAALLEFGDELQPPTSGLDRALQRARRWRDESDLLDEDLFAERLAQQGLTPDRFLHILAEPATGWQRRAGAPPAWIEPLVRACSEPVPPLPDVVPESLGVLELLRPLIANTCARLLDGLRRITAETPLFDPERLAGQLLDTLLRRLRWASERVLVLELHISRLEGKLQGETPEERFGSFVSLLREPGTALEILRRYPVLARDACRHADQWAATSLEMMKRFAADRREILERLADGEDAGLVVAVRTGLSDRHAGGQSVAILTFASGLRVVYKPKPLGIDTRFRMLIDWLNERGAPALRCGIVLDRGSYGWMEHIAPRPCETADEVERFHERQGAWAALFYGLEASDFHYENVIAAGEHPVPIDLETLLQPTLSESATLDGEASPAAQTVLSSGLLPRRFGSNGVGKPDLSGMGAVGGQSLEVERITDEGTDRMRWASAWTEMPAGPNVPTLQGRPVEIWQQDEAVLRGFRSMYRLLERSREELLEEGSPLLRIAALPVRVLLRPTNVYAHLFQAGNHPDFLQSGLDRDRLFDRLWLDAVRHLPLRRGVRMELIDMAEGDIPLFTALPGSPDLLHSSGRIEGLFAASGLEMVRRRLRGLGEEDLERQCWLVRASLEAMRPIEERRAWQASPLPEAAEPAPPERFLEAARRIGDRLAGLMFEQGDLVTWFHLDLEAEGWRFQPVPVGLYGGLSGIALFLAHLGCLPDGERYERLARRAVGTIRKRLDEDTAAPGLGAFGGSGSALYTFTHLGLLWGEPDLLDAAEELASRLSPSIESDTVFDLIGGSAGTAAILLALHRHRPSPALLEIAIRCGDRLLATAIQSERGIGWSPFREVDTLPLTGFGHGTAGIAWALAHLAHATGERRFEEAARGAISYERSWFCPERGSWPDLRGDRGTGEEREFMYAWCHGAPGSGLGRAGMLPCLDDPEMRSEIRMAVRSTLAEGFGFNHSLCHGDLGNLELVREAGRVLDDEELTAEAERLAARILERIETEGLRCGANLTSEIPGLMTGLAGIGYGLLRAAEPQRVPSVLLLETPQPD